MVNTTANKTNYLQKSVRVVETRILGSRITLTITDVRVERVQEISEGDAMAEGCFNDTDPYWRPTYGDSDSGGCPSFKNSFEFLWDSINQKRGYGWDKNPLVWVVEFEVKP